MEALLFAKELEVPKERWKECVEIGKNTSELCWADTERPPSRIRWIVLVL